MLTSGDVVGIDLGPPQGREAGRSRPAVVVTAQRILNATPSVVHVVPLTTTIRRFDSEILIDPHTDNGLRRPSAAQCQHIRAVPAARVERVQGNVGPAALAQNARGACTDPRHPCVVPGARYGLPMGNHLSVADLAHAPLAAASGTDEWRRGDIAEAVLLTLELSSRDLHARNATCWVWTGLTPEGDPAWALPVAASDAERFAPQGPARILAQLVGAAVEIGADGEATYLVDWHGFTGLVAPKLDVELAPAAIAEALQHPARAMAAALPSGVAVDGEPLPLSAVRGADVGVSVLARANHVHPVDVVLSLAGHGQPVDLPSYPKELAGSLREWGCYADPPPPPEASLAIDDDPCPRRRHARKLLQRLLRMRKIGDQYHTAFDHMYRGAPAHERHDALEVGEALIRGGLMGEKPSVGQRHVYLRRDALPAIHALVSRGETSNPALAAEWTAPAPQGRRRATR